MALQNSFEITADLKKTSYQKSLTVIQNDDITFVVIVKDDELDFPLTEVTNATLANVRLDKVAIVTPGTINGNEITFKLGTNETAVPGRVDATVQLYDADGRVSTVTFNYKVIKDPTGSGFIPSQNEQTLIQVVLGDGPLIIQEAQTAGEYAQSQGDYVESKRELIDTFTGEQTNLQAQVNQLVVDGDSSPEAAQARVGSDATSYPTLKARLDAEQNSVTSQLAETANNLINNVTQRPMVTFIDDDGAAGVWTVLKQVFESRGVPCTIALVSSFLTNGIGSSKAHLLQLQNELGWEVASHTKTHQQLNNLSLMDAEAEMRDSLSELTGMGFNVKHLVYPYGGPNEAVRNLARKYYKSAVNAAGGGLNSLPIKQYSINRIGLGSYEEVGKDNLAAYQALVDQAITNKTWLIFMLHIGETDAQGVQDLGDIIDYIQSQSVDIVNLNDGYEVFGNVLFNGNYNGSFDNDEFNIITKTGQQFENHIKKTDVNSTTLVNKFPIGESVKTFLNVDASGFPGATGAGTLHTYRDANSDFGFSHQIFRPYNTTNIYIRYANANNTWGVFTRIDCDTTRESKVIIGSQNQFVAANVPTDFAVDRVTINTVLNASASGFPNNLGGTLITTRMTTDNGYCSQTFQNYSTGNIYIREYVGSAWTVWKQQKTGLPKITYIYTGGTIPAQSGLRITVPYTGVAINDVISVSSQTQLPLGISFHARMSNTDSVEVNFVNCTTGAVVLGSTTLCLVAVRN